MRTFDVQAVEIAAPAAAVFEYVAEPRHLPEWTHAFREAEPGRAVMETPRGAVEVGLEIRAAAAQGTIDWVMRFPDGSRAEAASRVVAAGPERSVYSFVLLPPPVPLERLEGALEEQSRILRDELEQLRRRLGER